MSISTTPGFYVERKVPRPVAEASDTALPVIMGFTADGKDENGNSLYRIPTLVTSLKEYERFFGGMVTDNNSAVRLDDSGGYVSSDSHPRTLTHDSVRLYFENGGRQLIIYSFGNTQYSNRSDAASLYIEALDVIASDTRITLVLAPELILLTEDGYFQVARAILEHCSKQQNRFAILDVWMNGTWTDSLDTFRQKLLSPHLSYGAAYAPYLMTDLPRKLSYVELYGNFRNAYTNNAVTLNDFTTDQELTDLIAALDARSQEYYTLLNGLGGLLGAILTGAIPYIGPYPGITVQTPNDIFDSYYNHLKEALDKGMVYSEVRTRYVNLIRLYYEYLSKTLDDWTQRVDLGNDIKAFIKAYIDDHLTPFAQGEGLKILSVIDQTGADNGGPFGNPTGFPIYAEENSPSNPRFPLLYNGKNGNGNWDGLRPVTTTLPGYTGPVTDAVAIENIKSIMPLLQGPAQLLIDSVLDVIEHARSEIYRVQYRLERAWPLFKAIMDGARAEAKVVPASALAAAHYSRSDFEAGPWLAPANAPVRRVLGPMLSFNQKDLEEFYLDSTGKSINVVRPVHGKGIRIWGARTLAGTSAEWRYIPVRRLFLTVEKAVRGFMEAFVFEANDARTWLEVRTAVNNYLLKLFRQGAFQGSRPDDAYFIRIGLGESMNNNDVLEGRMILSVGMAVARPAEYIVLRLVQEQQEQ